MRPNAWRRTLPLALAAVALVAFASAAVAQPDPWQQAAARVEFPIYRPAVTLGFAPGPVVVERCGDSGNTWVRASYSEGQWRSEGGLRLRRELSRDTAATQASE